MKKVHVGVTVVAMSVVSAMCVARAGAQATAEPFHAGQWGIETDVMANGGSVLRFFTPRTAMLLGATVVHSKFSEANGSNGTVETSDNVLNVLVGVRHHSPIAPGLMATTAVSAYLGSAQEHREFTAVPSQNTSYRSDNYGVFGEVGAQYMPTSHVAVGVAYRLVFRHDKVKTFDETGNRIMTVFPPIRLTLYF